MTLDPSGERLKELHGLITDAIARTAAEPSMRTGKRSRRHPASGEPANSPPRNLLSELLKETEGDD